MEVSFVGLAHKAHKKYENIPRYDNYKVGYIEDLIREFIDPYYSYSQGYIESDRLKEYPILSIRDTDTPVGLFALFFDDEFICCRSLASRKGSNEFAFVDQVSCQKFMKFLKKLKETHQDSPEPEPWENVDYLDEDDYKKSEANNYFRLNSYDEIYQSIYKHAYLNIDGNFVKCDSYEKANDKDYSENIIVELDGKKIKKSFDDVYFKFFED